MKALWDNIWTRRLISSLAAMAILAVVTGPPGSNLTPLAGFTGSFAERVSFFGLFKGQRWMVFFVFALVMFAIWWTWVSYGEQIKGALSKTLAAPQAATRRRPVRWGIAIVLIVVAALLPHVVTDPFWQAAMVEQIGVFVLLALGLNVVVGFAGLLDLGFVAFYAVGAYATAWVTGALPLPFLFGGRLDTFWAIPFALALVMLAGNM